MLEPPRVGRPEIATSRPQAKHSPTPRPRADAGVWALVGLSPSLQQFFHDFCLLSLSHLCLPDLVPFLSYSPPPSAHTLTQAWAGSVRWTRSGPDIRRRGFSQSLGEPASHGGLASVGMFPWGSEQTLVLPVWKPSRASGWQGRAGSEPTRRHAR